MVVTTIFPPEEINSPRGARIEATTTITSSFSMSSSSNILISKQKLVPGPD